MQLAERSDDGDSTDRCAPGTGAPGATPRNAAPNLFVAALIQQLPALRARALRLELAASEADVAAARRAADNPEDDRPSWLKASPEDIRELAAEMPPALAEALELVFFQGLSYVEAASRLGIRVPTVGTRLVRARAYLRSRLQQQLGRRGSRMGRYVS
jgi:DNA-directed RNA polymerase specialized sigma24 family protein